MFYTLLSFIALKVLGVVNWSWWIVLIPLWTKLISRAFVMAYEQFFNWFENINLN